ncbi:MAG: FHA domain-containing protein [Oligoflexia bacterium]|nr:FHA domain-containing protein [Oligoflexia bacterium]
MRLRLEISVNGVKQKQASLDKKKNVIGRGSHADIRIITESISRVHLAIEVEGQEIYLTDLGSSNGSFIGDEPLEANKKTLFDTFFLPIKLGKEVFILIERCPI